MHNLQALLKEHAGGSDRSLVGAGHSLELQMAEYKATVQRLAGMVQEKDQAKIAQKTSLLDKHERDLLNVERMFKDSTVGQMQVWLQCARQRQAWGGMIALRQTLGRKQDQQCMQAVWNWWGNQVKRIECMRMNSD